VSKKVSEAITQARTAARAIVARVQKAGETAATVVAELSIRRIEEARFSFLDFDEAATQAAEQPARALDLGPDPAIAQLALGYEGAAARNGTTYERGL
jgi:aminoglycoside N3'-acetyltransferase